MTRASFWRLIRSWGWCTSICWVRRQRSGGHVVLCHRSLFTEPDTREWIKWVEFLQNLEDFLLESFTDFVKCCSSENKSKSRLFSERTSFCECLGVLGWVKVRTGDWQPKPREKPYRGKSSMTRNLRSSCLLPLDDPEDAQCRPSGLHHLCCVTNFVAESENSMCCEVVII